MKYFLPAILVFVSFATQAQESTSYPKLLIGFSFSPDYSYRKLVDNNGNPFNDMLIKTRNETETGKLGYTTGLNLWFNFSRKIGIETGLQFSNKGYKTKDLETGLLSPDPGKVRFTYSFSYIGIPLKAKFAFGKNKIRFVPAIGVMTNFLVGDKLKAVYKYSDGRTETKKQSISQDFKDVDISPLISLGIDYKINKKMYLLAEPTFRYGTIKTTNTPVAEILWNAGINLGFYYLLK